MPVRNVRFMINIITYMFHICKRDHCQSERSEESAFGRMQTVMLRFLAALGMTGWKRDTITLVFGHIEP